MKKLTDVNFELWFLGKNPALCAAACNAAYTYEVVKESEKAVCFKIDSERRNPLKGEWLQWIPKCAVKNKKIQRAGGKTYDLI